MIVDRHAHTYITTTLIVIVKPTSLSSSCILGEYLYIQFRKAVNCTAIGTGMGRRMALEGPLEPAGCTAQSLGDTAWGAFFWYVLSNPEKKVPFYTVSLTKLKTSAMNITCVLGIVNITYYILRQRLMKLMFYIYFFLYSAGPFVTAIHWIKLLRITLPFSLKSNMHFFVDFGARCAFSTAAAYFQCRSLLYVGVESGRNSAVQSSSTKLDNFVTF